MSGSQNSEDFIETWAQAQRELWSLWLGQDPASADGAPAGPLDSLSWLRKAADLWGQQGAVGRTVGSLLGSQEMMTRSTELLMQAWQQVLPKLQAGEDWQSALRTYLDGWVEQVAGMPEQAAGAGKEAAQLLNSLLMDWSPVVGPWLSSAFKSGLSGEVGAGLLNSSVGLERLLAMEQEFEPAISGLGEIPRAGLLRERNAKLLLAMDAFQALRNATLRYQALVAQGLAEAVEHTIRHVIEQAEAGQPVVGMRGLVRDWFRIADRTLLGVFSTPAFIAAQNEVAAASMDYKVRQRELLTLVYEALEIPTRDELDDVYRSLHALKREVRELRRQQRPPRQRSAAREVPAAADAAGRADDRSTVQRKPKARKRPAGGPETAQ